MADGDERGVYETVRFLAPGQRSSAVRPARQGQPAYAGNKEALNALARMLAAEIARRGDLAINTMPRALYARP